MDRPLRNVKNSLIYCSVRMAFFFLDLLPYAWLAPLGGALGTLAFTLAASERRRTLEHLDLAYGDSLRPEEKKAIARRVWKNVSWNMLEFIRWRNWSAQKVASQVRQIHGFESFQEIFGRGQGVLVTTAHLGNWELLSCVGAQLFPGKFTIVARQLYDPRMDALVTSIREGFGARVVQRGLALRGILKALQQGSLVGLLLDQDTGRDGVFVSFFGHPAWTQSGPAHIARRTGTPIVPAFIVRLPQGGFEVHVEPPIEVAHTSDEEKDVRDAVQRYTESIEKYVRAYPDQWVWMHRRWRTQPPREATTPKEMQEP